MIDEIQIDVSEQADNIPAGRVPSDWPIKWYGEPDRADVCVYCTQSVLQAVQRHARDNSSREIGGILLGEVMTADGYIYVVVNRYLRAKDVGDRQSGRSHFNFSPEVWADLHRRIDNHEEYRDRQIVGWFHSHPGHGIFLSADPMNSSADTPISDEFIHTRFFNKPWHIAFVYDPILHQGGFFVWQHQIITRAPGFVEIQDIDSQKSLVTWNEPLTHQVPSLAEGSSPESNARWHHILTSASTLLIAGAIALLIFLTLLVSVGLRALANRNVPDEPNVIRGPVLVETEAGFGKGDDAQMWLGSRQELAVRASAVQAASAPTLSAISLAAASPPLTGTSFTSNLPPAGPPSFIDLQLAPIAALYLDPVLQSSNGNTLTSELGRICADVTVTANEGIPVIFGLLLTNSATHQQVHAEPQGKLFDPHNSGEVTICFPMESLSLAPGVWTAQTYFLRTDSLMNPVKLDSQGMVPSLLHTSQLRVPAK